jgi:hypothetical protein
MPRRSALGSQSTGASFFPPGIAETRRTYMGMRCALVGVVGQAGHPHLVVPVSGDPPTELSDTGQLGRPHHAAGTRARATVLS